MDIFRKTSCTLHIIIARYLQIYIHILVLHFLQMSLFCLAGTEFYNNDMSRYLRRRGVQHFSTSDHATLCEVFIYKLKKAITKYILYKNRARYIDVLQDLVKSVNNTYHRVIGTTPQEAWESRGDQFAQIFMRQYFDKERFKRKKPKRVLTKYKIKQKVRAAKKPKYHFSIADVVRIELADDDKLTHKGYRINFSNEVFTIHSRRMLEGTDYYILKDENNEILKTSFIYTQLQRVAPDDDREYKIEKVIRT